MPDLDLGHVRDQHRLAVLGGHHGAPDIVEVAEDADAADHQCLVAAPQRAAADVGVVVDQRRAHLVDGDAVALQGIGIDLHLVFLDRAAEADDVGHARHDAQIGPDHPVLQRTDLVLRHLGRRFHDVAENLADGGRQRRQARLDAGRQRHLLQLFQHLLAREVVVGAVLEGQRDHRQPGDGHRAQLDLARHAAHLALDRQRHGALDFFRRLPRILRDDLHLHVLHVRERLDRQVGQRAVAEDGQRRRQHQHEDPLRQDEFNQFIEHRNRPRS